MRLSGVEQWGHQLCNAPVAEWLFRGEMRFHKLPLHLCQIKKKKNPNNHKLHKGQSLWLVKQKQVQHEPGV